MHSPREPLARSLDIAIYVCVFYGERMRRLSVHKEMKTKSTRGRSVDRIPPLMELFAVVPVQPFYAKPSSLVGVTSHPTGIFQECIPNHIRNLINFYP